MNKLTFFRERQCANELASIFDAKQIALLITSGYAMLTEAKNIKEHKAWGFFEMSKQDVINDINIITDNLMELTMALGLVEKFQICIHNDKPLFLHLN